MNLANSGPVRPRVSEGPASTGEAKSSGAWLRHAAFGALFGALSGLLLVQLGAREILGSVRYETIVVTCLVLGAVVGSVAGALSVAATSGVLLLVYLFVAYSPVIPRRLPAWVRVDSLPPTADAVVVLSAEVMSDSALSAVGLDRLLTGLELLERGIAPRIVTSRVSIPADGANGAITSDADQQRTLALGRGTWRWDVVGNAHSTRDEAVGAARLLLPTGARAIVVVTSPMHTRRACATFEAVGFVVTCRATREHDVPTWHPRSPHEQLAAFRNWAYERLGMVKYRAEGWVGAGR